MTIQDQKCYCLYL